MNQQEKSTPSVLLPFIHQTNDMSTTAWNRTSTNSNINDRKTDVTLNNDERIVIRTANVNDGRQYEKDRGKGEREDVVNRTKQTNTFTIEQYSCPYVDNTMSNYHSSSSSSYIFNSKNHFFPQARSRTRYEPSYPSIHRFYSSPVRTLRDLDDPNEEIIQEEIIEITNYDHYPTLMERWGDDAIPRIHHEGDLKIEEYIEFEEIEPTITEEISYEIVYSGEQIQTMREIHHTQSESRNFRKLKKRRVKRKRAAISQSGDRFPLINNGIQVHNIDLIHEQKKNSLEITQQKDEKNIEIPTQSNEITDEHDPSLLLLSSSTSFIDHSENKENILDKTQDLFHRNDQSESVTSINRDRLTSMNQIANKDEKSINNLVNEADKQQAETVSTQSTTTITLDERLNQHTDDNKNESIIISKSIIETTNETVTLENKDNEVEQYSSDFLVDIAHQIQNITDTTHLPTETNAELLSTPIESTSNMNSTLTNASVSEMNFNDIFQDNYFPSITIEQSLFNDIPTDIEQTDDKKTASDLIKMYYELQEQRQIQSVLEDNLQTEQNQDILDVNLSNQNGTFDVPLFSIRSNLPSREYRQVFGSSDEFVETVNDLTQSLDQKSQPNKTEEQEKCINQISSSATSNAELNFRYSTLLDRIDALIKPLIDLPNTFATEKVTTSNDTNVDIDQTTVLTESTVPTDQNLSSTIVTNENQQPENVQGNVVNTKRANVSTNKDTAPVQTHENQTTKQSVTSNHSCHASQYQVATNEYDRLSSSQQSSTVNDTEKLSSQQLQVIGDNYPWYSSHYTIIDAEAKFARTSSISANKIQMKEIDEPKSTLPSVLLKTIENIVPTEPNSKHAKSTPEIVKTEVTSKEEHHQGVLDTIVHAISNVKDTISNLRSQDESQSTDVETTTPIQEQVVQDSKQSFTSNGPSISQQSFGQQLQVIGDNYPWYSNHYAIIDAETKFAQVSSLSTNEIETKEIDEPKSSLSTGLLKTIENIFPSGLLSTILPTETNSRHAQSTEETIETEITSKEEHHQGVLDTIVHAISNVKDTISNLHSHDESQSTDVETTTSIQEQVVPDSKQSVTSNYPWYASRYKVVTSENDRLSNKQELSTIEAHARKPSNQQLKIISDNYPLYSNHYTIFDAETKLSSISTKNDTLCTEVTVAEKPVTDSKPASIEKIPLTEVTNEEEHRGNTDSTVQTISNVKNTISSFTTIHDENIVKQINASNESSTSNHLSHPSQQLQVINDDYPSYSNHYNIVDAEEKLAYIIKPVNVSMEQSPSPIMIDKQPEVQNTEDSDDSGFRVVQRRKRIPSSTTHEKTTMSTISTAKPVLSSDIDLEPVILHGNPNAVVPIPIIIPSTTHSSSKKKHKKKKNDKKEMILFDAPEPESSQTLANEHREEIIVPDQELESEIALLQPDVPAISNDQNLSTNLSEDVEIGTNSTEHRPAETATKINISPLSLTAITKPKQEKVEVREEEEEEEDNEGFELVRYHKRILSASKSDRTPPITPTLREIPDFSLNEKVSQIAQHPDSSPKKKRNKHKKQKKQPDSTSNTDHTSQIEQETLVQPSEIVATSPSIVTSEPIAQPNSTTILLKSVTSPKQEEEEQEDEDDEGFQIVTYRKRITSAPIFKNTRSSPVTQNRYERNTTRNIDSKRFDLHGRHGSASPSILRTNTNNKISTNQQKEVKFMENIKQTSSVSASPRPISVEAHTPTTVNSTGINSQKSEQQLEQSKNETIVDVTPQLDQPTLASNDVKIKPKKLVVQEPKPDSLPSGSIPETIVPQTTTQKKKAKKSKSINVADATPLSIEETTNKKSNDSVQSISSPVHEQTNNANAVTLVNTTSEATYESENIQSPSYSILSIPSTTTAVEEVSALLNDIPTATSNEIENEVSTESIINTTDEHVQNTSNKKRRKKKPQNKAKSNDEEPSISSTQTATTTPSNAESKWPTMSNSYTAETYDQSMSSLSPTSKTISKEMNNKLDLFLPEYIREQIDTPSTITSSDHVQKKKPRLKMLKKDPEAKSLLTNEFDTEQQPVVVNDKNTRDDEEEFVVHSEEKTSTKSIEQITDDILSRGFHIWLKQSQAVTQPKKDTTNLMQSIIIQPVRTTEDDEDEDYSNTSKTTKSTFMIDTREKKRIHINHAYSINHPESNTTPSWLISQSNDKNSHDDRKNFDSDHKNDSSNDKSTEQVNRSSNSNQNLYQQANSTNKTTHQKTFDDWAHFLDIKNSFYLGNDLPTSLECFYTQTVDEDTLLSDSIPIQQSIPNQCQRYGDFLSDNSDAPITRLPFTQSRPSNYFHNSRRQEFSSIENQTNDDDDEIFISHSINGLSRRLRP